MNTFNYEGTGSLSNINVRRENVGQDDRQLGADLKMSIRGYADHLGPLLGSAEAAQELKAGLWNGEGILRSMQIGSIHLISKFEHYQLEVDGHVMRDVTLDQFTVTPAEGYILEIDLRAKLHPDQDLVADLSEAFLDESVEIKIEVGDPELPFGEGDRG